jgi:hypothetical protein
MVETVIRTLLIDFNLVMLAVALVMAGIVGWKRRGEASTPL